MKPVTLRLSSGARGPGLYFTEKPGDAFHKDRTVAFTLKPDGPSQQHFLTIAAQTLHSLRVDPGNTPGTIVLESIELLDADGKPVSLPDLAP